VDEKKLAGLTIEEKRAIVLKENDDSLSVRQQCELLGLNRSTLYYEPVGLSEEDQRLMDAIDVEYTKTPFYGARKIARELRQKGWAVGRKRIGRLMRLMGLEAIVPKKNLSRRNPDHKIYPYLLRGVTINRVNQVWGMDITYIRLGRGFAYLTAIVDWHSRYVISWRLSNTLSTDFCLECLQEALQYGTPEIFNTDQGCQFTSEEFTQVLRKNGIKISMDGRGRALDNIFVERLWRTVKYENVYLKGYQTIPEAREGLREYFDWYNMERSHQSLAYETPWSMYAGLKIVAPEGAEA
jgi:putative transposase